MVEIDRIYSLAEEQGMKKQFLCQQIGINEAYFRQAKAKNVLPESVVEKAAVVLNTTTDYLHGKTDKKEKPGEITELTVDEIKWLNIFRSFTQQEKERYLALFDAHQE